MRVLARAHAVHLLLMLQEEYGFQYIQYKDVLVAALQAAA